ncbi:MAG: phage tail tip lysozyme, partial [Nitrososphaeraceae archaeon]|nr:phage tail tip lysozyme [Nitrososphaeraceae archaeon]
LMQRAQSMFRTLRSMGFSKYGAAALVGSMMQESGINPNAVEGNGQGHGLLQWSFDRRDKLKRQFGADWNKASNQLQFMMGETSERGNLKRLMNAQSREEAFAAEKAYIRYGIAGNRHTYADQIMQQPWFKYKGHVPTPFRNISALTSQITNTHAMIKEANTLESKHEENLDFDLLDPNYSGAQQLFELGKKVAPGVISKLDETISNCPLYSF